jgi:N-acetyl-anhydromuramyl-L-alanine amidase AmpD
MANVDFSSDDSYAYQRGLITLEAPNFGPVDGKFGPRTLAALRTVNVDFLKTQSDRTVMPRPKHIGKTIPNRKITKIFLHWSGGAGDARKLAEYYANQDPTRKSSAHWAVDENGAFQILEHDTIAWHVVGHNADSIGVDICQYPFYDKIGQAAAYKRGLTLKPAEKPYGALDPRIQKHTVALLVLLKSRYPSATILSHHEATPGKIDIIPWKAGILRDLGVYFAADR